MNANRNIKINTGKSAKTTEKLSSGYRINRAADDAAGLSISEKMRRLIRGLTQASRNCQDGISMVQTAEGALNEVHDMLQRMNELAVQSANGTNAEEDREALQQEFAQIQDEIDRVSQTTQFNEMRLFADEDSGTGTNGGNTPSVTSLDGADSEAPVMRMMSLRSVAAVAETSVTVGDFTLTGAGLVEGEDYSYSDNKLTILSSKDITVSGTTTADYIEIGDNVTANLTINNLNIAVSSQNYGCPINVSTSNGVLNLTVEGTNTLSGYVGIMVSSGATLVITDKSTGTLNATGTNWGAGIGSSGYNGDSAGNIIINGGTITANGGSYGAGIGGGCDGSGGNITINGGTITANGGSYGAGIGGGCNGSGGNITINGGTIKADGKSYGDGIGNGLSGSGANITINGGSIETISEKKSQYCIGGSFSTGVNGSATITATHISDYNCIISDTSNQSKWSGTINGTSYNNATETGEGVIDLSALTDDFEITDKGYRLNGTWYAYTGEYQLSGTTTKSITVSGNQTINLSGDAAIENLTVHPDKKLIIKGEHTLTVNGTITNLGEIENNATLAANNTLNNSGTIQNNGTLDVKGTLINNGTITGDGKLISQGTGVINLNDADGPIEITDTGYKIGDKEYYYTGTYTLSGTTTQDITVSSNATITLSGDAEVNGIIVDSGKTLTINGDKKLTVNGGIINNGTIENNSTIHSKGIIVGKENITGTGTLILESTGNIDLSKLTDTLTITDTGYTIGTQQYSYTGDYTFTGATDKAINVNTSANITLNGVTSTSNLNISNNSTVTATLVGNNTIDTINVASGSKLILDGTGTLNATTSFYTEGSTTINSGVTVVNNGLMGTEKGGTVDNYGHIINNNTIKNGHGRNNGQATFTNYGVIDSNGDSDINNYRGFTNESTGTINLNGTSTLYTSTVTSQFINNGTLNVGENATFVTAHGNSNNPTINNGKIVNNGSTTLNTPNFTNNGTIENNNSMNATSVYNNGNIVNNDSGTVKYGTVTNNDGGVISNAGTMKSTTNSSTLTNKDGGTVNNTGEWSNSGTINNENGGTINNSGTLGNTSSGTITNDGTIENTGTLDNSSGTVTNNGTINDSGTVSGTIGGNQPVDSSGSGGGTGGGTGGGSGTGGSTGGGTGGGSGSSGTGGATAGTAKNSWWIQAGAEAGQGINIEIGAMNTKVLGIDKATVNILTQESSGNAITAVSGAIEKLSEQRSRLGAYQNRLEHTIRNLDNVVENTTYAESRIRDADMAELMVEHANNNIIMQAAQAMLAQANHQPDGVLQLLQ